jgi:hypothetical protein
VAVHDVDIDGIVWQSVDYNPCIACTRQLLALSRRSLRRHDRYSAVALGYVTSLLWRCAMHSSLGSQHVNTMHGAPCVLQERTALSSSVLSPTQSALSSLPSDKLVGRTMEGKKLRRHVLRGAVVVFVTAGYSGKKCVFRHTA